MRIWAHRGCSQMYPENTLTSFKKAMEVPGIAGVELDVQIKRAVEEARPSTAGAILLEGCCCGLYDTLVAGQSGISV